MPATVLLRLSGFPSGASGKEPTCWCRRHETQVGSLGREDPLEGTWPPTPVFVPGESRGQRRLAGHSPWGHREWDMRTPFTPEFW